MNTAASPRHPIGCTGVEAEGSMDRPTIREAVAVFDDAESLETAVSDLQSNGIDRSDLSVLAHASLAESRSGDLSIVGEDSTTMREPVVSDTDLRQGRILGTSLAATVAGLAAAGVTVATGGVAAAAIAAAAVAAGGVGAAGTLVGRTVADDQESFLDVQLAHGGVLLWVRIRDANAEQRAIEVLRRYSPHVHVHDLPTEGALRFSDSE
jgi:hypothetical protein